MIFWEIIYHSYHSCLIYSKLEGINKGVEIKKTAKDTDNIRIMKIQIGIIVFLLGVLLPAVSPGRLYGEDKVYTVQKGDTLYSIARAQGLKPEDLMKYNGISDPARLLAGQRLKIPVPAVTTVSGAITTYRVVRGDTFYSIARKFSVSVAALMEANSLPANYMLREGDSLRLPGEVRLPGAAGQPAGTMPQPDAKITGTGAGTAAQSPAAKPAAAAIAAEAPQGGTVPRETVTGTVNPSVRWPVNARELSYMTGKLSGVVITGARSESIQSLTQGTVLSAGPFQGFGRVAIIQVEGGYLYVYGGCESLSVKEGDKVGPGTELGKLGIDAVSNKAQLFFMVYRSNTPIDPAKAPRA